VTAAMAIGISNSDTKALVAPPLKNNNNDKKMISAQICIKTAF
jgi:uncharacterized protein YoaH (UPF0181 family)